MKSSSNDMVGIYLGILVLSVLERGLQLHWRMYRFIIFIIIIIIIIFFFLWFEWNLFPDTKGVWGNIAAGFCQAYGFRTGFASCVVCGTGKCGAGFFCL